MGVGVEDYDRLLQAAQARYGSWQDDMLSVEKARLEASIEGLKDKTGSEEVLLKLKRDLQLLGLVMYSEGGGVDGVGKIN